MFCSISYSQNCASLITTAKNYIDTYIVPNGTNAITGQRSNTALNYILTALKCTDTIRDLSFGKNATKDSFVIIYKGVRFSAKDSIGSGGGGGSGTVTSVSVATANGVSGTVANSTTTPTLTLTLGAITPTSVNGVVISTLATKTALNDTALALRNIRKVDTIYKKSTNRDLTYFKINGTEYSFKDSSGTSSAPSLQDVCNVSNSTSTDINTLDQFGNIITSLKNEGNAGTLTVATGDGSNEINIRSSGAYIDFKNGVNTLQVRSDNLSDNRNQQWADANGVHVMSVNGQTADNSGNVTLTTIGIDSSLFLNGFDLVFASRDFLPTDQNKILALAGGVHLTMPIGSTFTGSPLQPIGIISFNTDNSFELNPGEVVRLRDSDTTAGEFTLLITGDNGTQSSLVLIGSSFVLNGQTSSSYIQNLFTQINNTFINLDSAYIPLSGTVTGSPVTGILAFKNDDEYISIVNTSDVNQGGINNNGQGAVFKTQNNLLSTAYGNGTILMVGDDANSLSVECLGAAPVGVVLADDYSANYTDFALTQKKYVDNLTIKGTYNSGAVVAQTTFTVTIPTQENTDYVVITEADNLLSAPVRYVTNKTTTTFDIVYLSALTGTVSIGYILRK